MFWFVRLLSSLSRHNFTSVVPAAAVRWFNKYLPSAGKGEMNTLECTNTDVFSSSFKASIMKAEVWNLQVWRDWGRDANSRLQRVLIKNLSLTQVWKCTCSRGTIVLLCWVVFFSVCNLAHCVYSAGITPDVSPAHIPHEWAHPRCQGNVFLVFASIIAAAVVESVHFSPQAFLDVWVFCRAICSACLLFFFFFF